ncbi:hypothetical protein [Nocardioides sp. GCM10030258]|uniref:hypothetical protein n=1 Tax=unclassified Nocardioides TaxID=2615069 RepID=UPI003623EBC4
MPVLAPSLPTSGSRRLPLVAGALTLLLLAFGLTGATATSGTTGVAITPLAPVKVITGAASVQPGKTYVFVASGGTTTVPTNALVVELAITAKGTKAGTLSFAPLGEPGNGSPTAVAWAAGGSSVGTVRVNVGNSNKVVVTNSSLGVATVGVKITGYSTLVSAAGISGVGGTNGQVLTNNGDGTAAWKALPAPPAVPVVLKAAVTGSGAVVLGSVTATKNSTGRYTVTFPRTLAGCAVSGTVGTYNGGSFFNGSVIKVSSFAASPDVNVFIDRGDTVVPRDSDFLLTVIC